MVTIDLSKEHLELVKDLLKQNLPADTRVWVFGSRINGRSKPFSDLDLAIEAEEKLDSSIWHALSESFENSELPFKVDLVDIHAVSDRFKKIIDAHKVELIFI